MANIQISVMNRCSVLSDADIHAAMSALQMQVSQHFQPVWGVDADLLFVPLNGMPNAGTWWVGVFDNSDMANAFGYHDLTSEGLPNGKVFAGSDLLMNHSWTVTASHEILEMLVDPDISLTAFVQTPGTSGELYAYEVCDPCEADEFGYEIEGVLVSDFVFPEWFESFRQPGSAQFDFTNQIAAPFTLLPGGYIGVYDMGSRSGWHQIQMRDAQPTTAMRARLGSRRERRRTLRGHWVPSSPVNDSEVITRNLRAPAQNS